MADDAWWIANLEKLSEQMDDAGRHEHGGGNELWMLDDFIEQTKKKIAVCTCPADGIYATPELGGVEPHAVGCPRWGARITNKEEKE